MAWFFFSVWLDFYIVELCRDITFHMFNKQTCFSWLHFHLHLKLLWYSTWSFLTQSFQTTSWLASLCKFLVSFFNPLLTRVLQLNECLYKQNYILCYILGLLKSFLSCAHILGYMHLFIHVPQRLLVVLDWSARTNHIVFIYWWHHLVATVKLKSLLYAYT